jgi:hypothetical protein
VLVRGGRIALVAYLGTCLVISFLQDSLIFPGASTQGRKEAVVRPSGGEELVHLTTADGDSVYAIFGKAMNADGTELADASTRPTILFFYGNGMCMADCDEEFRKFRRLGLNAMIPDFVGYGMSGGKPSERGVYATAETAYAYLISRGDINPKKIVPAGWSLGAAAAIELAAKHPGPGLVTMSAFTSMTDMARKVLPIFPASLLLKHRFENEAKLREISCPVLIFHGTQDSIIPFAMSQKLEAAAKGKAERIAVQNADHNDLFEVGGEEMFDAIGKFVDDVTRKNTSATNNTNEHE